MVLSNFSTEDAFQDEIIYLNNQKIDVSDKINIEFKITNASKECYAVISLFPFLKVDGIVKRIKTLHFKI